MIKLTRAAIAFVSLAWVVTPLYAGNYLADPGVPDTVRLEVEVDTIQRSITARLYVFSDEDLGGVSAGFGWDNPNCRLDSAIVEPNVDSEFDLLSIVFEDDELDVSNENRHFCFQGAGYSTGLPAADSSRLWATYYFTLLEWNGYSRDGLTMDTVSWDGGSVLLFGLPDHAGVFQPEWSGGFHTGCSRCVYPDPDPGARDTVGIDMSYDSILTEITLELSGFFDEDLRSISVGLDWNYETAKMLSAEADTLHSLIDSYMQGPFIFHDNIIDSTNKYREFGYYHSSNNFYSSIAGTGYRRHLARFRLETPYLSILDTFFVDTADFGSFPPLTLKQKGQLIGFAPVWINALFFYNPNCCIGMRGNVDSRSAGDDEMNVGDVTFLASYIWSNGAVPQCLEEANIDGDIKDFGPIDVDDLAYLVDHIWRGGPSPPACPPDDWWPAANNNRKQGQETEP